MILQVLHCPNCQGTNVIRHGTTRQGKQRYRCQETLCKGGTFQNRRFLFKCARWSYKHEHTKTWAKKIASFDGYVFVTPEYNHGISGALKNAIDYLYREWNNKAAGFVSYGSANGVRAVEHLRLVMAELMVATVRAQVGLSLFHDFENFSTFKPGERRESELQTVLDQVVAWSEALKSVRGRQCVPCDAACTAPSQQRASIRGYVPERREDLCGQSAVEPQETIDMTTNPTEPATDAVNRTAQEILAALQAKDAAKVNSYYAPDAVIATAGRPAAKDGRAVSQAIRDDIADPNFTMSLSNEQTEVAGSGDLAYRRGTFEITYTNPQTTQAENGAGTYVTVFRKQADGSWKVVADFGV